MSNAERQRRYRDRVKAARIEQPASRPPADMLPPAPPMPAPATPAAATAALPMSGDVISLRLEIARLRAENEALRAAAIILPPKAAAERERLLRAFYATDSAAARADHAPPLAFLGVQLDGRADLTWLDMLALAPLVIDALGIGDVLRRFVADAEAHRLMDQAA